MTVVAESLVQAQQKPKAAPNAVAPPRRALSLMSGVLTRPTEPALTITERTGHTQSTNLQLNFLVRPHPSFLNQAAPLLRSRSLFAAAPAPLLSKSNAAFLQQLTTTCMLPVSQWQP